MYMLTYVYKYKYKYKYIYIYIYIYVHCLDNVVVYLCTVHHSLRPNGRLLFKNN